MEKWIEKFKALSVGEKIIIPAGVILFIVGFLPWYSVDLGPLGTYSRNGWESPGAIWSILAILVGLAMAGVVVVKNLGTVALVFVLIKLANESSHLGFAFYVGIIATAALAVAGFLMFREESAA
jgi:hypothetical protein